MRVIGDGPVRLLIVEREGLYRELLGSVLSEVDGLEVVGTFTSGHKATKALATLKPAVAVLDLDHWDGNGLRLALAFRQSRPSMGVVLLSSAHEIELLTELDAVALWDWCRLVDKGSHDIRTLGRAVQNAAVALTSRRNGKQPDRNGSVAGKDQRRQRLRLSLRQSEILGLVATGMSNAAVASELELKEKTVENQLAQIYEKLDIERERSLWHPRVKAVLWYLAVNGVSAPRQASALTSQSRSMSQGKR